MSTAAGIAATTVASTSVVPLQSRQRKRRPAIERQVAAEQHALLGQPDQTVIGGVSGLADVVGDLFTVVPQLIDEIGKR